VGFLLTRSRRLLAVPFCGPSGPRHIEASTSASPASALRTYSAIWSRNSLALLRTMTTSFHRQSFMLPHSTAETTEGGSAKGHPIGRTQPAALSLSNGAIEKREKNRRACRPARPHRRWGLLPRRLHRASSAGRPGKDATSGRLLLLHRGCQAAGAGDREIRQEQPRGKNQ